MTARREATPVQAPDNAQRAKGVVRNAWLLGTLAVLFYLGYLGWNLLRGAAVSLQ
jgi:hypothetical protein